MQRDLNAMAISPQLKENRNNYKSHKRALNPLKFFNSQIQNKDGKQIMELQKFK